MLAVHEIDVFHVVWWKAADPTFVNRTSFSAFKDAWEIVSTLHNCYARIYRAPLNRDAGQELCEKTADDWGQFSDAGMAEFKRMAGVQGAVSVSSKSKQLNDLMAQ